MGRTIGMLCIMVLLCSLFPFAAFSQEGNSLTQRDFAIMLFTAKQLDGRFPDAVTATDKIKILSDLGYTPESGYTPDSNLTLGDFSFIMVKVLKFESLLPENPTVADYIKVLAKDGIVKDGDPGTLLSKDDVIGSFKLAAIPYSPAKFPDYVKPLSPIE